MEKSKEKIVCNLCGNTDSKFFCSKNGYSLYKCSNCKLIFVYPTPESIDVYDDSYFSGAEKGFGYVDYDADKEPMISAFNHYIDLINNLGISSGKLLDIGAATGFFMSIAKKRGFNVVGVELSDFAARKGRENGLDIVTGDLLNTNFEGESFDVVTMFDVLEHVPDPKKLISEVSRILKPNGLIIVNTPDAESMWAKVLGKRWQLIMPPEHINYFSPKNLSKYLEDNGYDVKINTKIGKKFTLQYILKMLYKWQGLRIFLVKSNKFLSSISVPINLRDNFFMIAKKK